ncbi:MAG: hypothetical protein KatS3mg125_1079 [Lysobacterales bacterium]|jgi:hypothetical protein|nr:MAG: hypothetical protein KatS3mg125_1079 [Xanthomonadales bacterium]
MYRRHPERRWWRAPWLALLLLGPITLAAAPPARFEELPAEVGRVLEAFRSDWGRLSAQRREALVRAAEVWLELGREQRRLALRRLEIWESLTPEERARLRAHLRAGHGAGRRAPLMALLAELDRAERQALLARLRGLEPPERRRLRLYLMGLSREERLAWIRRWVGGDERALAEALAAPLASHR